MNKHTIRHVSCLQVYTYIKSPLSLWTSYHLVLNNKDKMNNLAVVLCVVLVCSCTIQAQFLSGLTSGQAFGLGLGLPFFLGGIGRGLSGRGGVGYPIPPPPQPFLLPPPVYQPITVHRRRYVRY